MNKYIKWIEYFVSLITDWLTKKIPTHNRKKK